MSQSTVWVDSRTGSKELLSSLCKLGLTAELTALDAGDFAFEGNGPDGRIDVGIERKTIPDLISSLREGRLQGRPSGDGEHARESQLDRMRKTYDLFWVLLEGQIGGDRRFGRLLKSDRGQKPLPGGYTEDSLTKAMLSIELAGGARIKQTASMHQSALFVCSVFHWFNDKLWDEHKTLQAPMRQQHGIMPLSDFRNIAMNLPGIGIAMSAAVEHYCMVDTSEGRRPSLTRMLSMSLSEWENLEETTTRGPRKLGAVRAGRVLDATRKLR